MPELITCKTLITYIAAKVRKNSLFSSFSKVYYAMRRIAFFGRVFRYLRIGFAIIEASAVLILFAAIFTVLVPIALIILAALALADFLIGSRILQSTQLEDILSRERIYIISAAGGFGDAFAHELAEGGAAVFVICPLSACRFITARWDDGVYYIRHAFFFRLKRRKLSHIHHKTVYLI